LNKYYDILPEKNNTHVLPSINADQIHLIQQYTNNYRTPLVIKGLIKDFPCVKKWDIEYLKKYCGQYLVKGFTKSDGTEMLTDQFNNVKVLENVKFSNACDMIKKGEQIYINNFHSIFIDCKILQKDLDLPPLLLMMPATFAASLGFMLPIATAANTIVFGTKDIQIREFKANKFMLFTTIKTI
jgi:hypothetical protein